MSGHLVVHPATALDLAAAYDVVVDRGVHRQAAPITLPGPCQDVGHDPDVSTAAFNVTTTAMTFTCTTCGARFSLAATTARPWAVTDLLDRPALYVAARWATYDDACTAALRRDIHVRAYAALTKTLDLSTLVGSAA